MSTALYRRYRPESFADVIGQEHVTLPLMTALEKNRVNHAYLFSGPRGCGKTTSARILARCLNCAEGPTPTPCGRCESCRDLSRDGGGSLDVIEMDAASHGGVDHARDLRERATFAPVRDRYKIFIIDEAHMVTREGFNALLKIVEEPPAHIKFIFATTEPNKVLGTIRSRTHHYPFRLVPPQVLGQYLARLCAEEGFQVAEGVLPLVVRAGGGSVRDSLSILDQLMAGASDDQGITYDLAVALLGFTHGELLDHVVDAFSSGQAAAVFTAVDQVIQAGQDPRRFVEDLLERFRDLIIVKAVPETAGSILRELAADQLERMRAQAEKLSSAELSRAADITNEALNEMSGATNPQLHLELLCARILLTSGDRGLAALAARLDRLERKVIAEPQGAPAQAGSSRSHYSPRGPVTGYPRTSSAEDTARGGSSSVTSHSPAPLPGAPLASAPLSPSVAQGQPAGATGSSQDQAPSAVTPAPATGSVDTAPSGENTVHLVVNSWPDILSHLPSPLARAQFALCEPVRFEKGDLFLLAELPVLKSVKDYLPQLQQALLEVLGLQLNLRGEIKKPKSSSSPQTQHEHSSLAPDQSSARPEPTPEPHEAQPQRVAPLSATVQSPEQDSRHLPPVDLAQGPRGGDQAWTRHGQPRSEQPPSWSSDDWNTSQVTSWNVATIPSEDPQTPPTKETAPQEPSQHSPHLRVIEGDADPVEIAKAHHPSRGGHELQTFTLASKKLPASETSPTTSQEPTKPEENYSASLPAPQLEPPALQPPAGEQVRPTQQEVSPPLSSVQPQSQEPKSSFRERHAAQIAAGKQALAQPQEQASVEEPEDFTPSDDDAALESTVLIGQKAVEKILGGKVIDEQPLHQG